MTPPPLHEGRQPLADGWTIDLPFPMARRIEEGSLVFWHSPRRLTLWIDVWTDASGAAPSLEDWQARRSRGAFDAREERDGTLLRASYRLAEAADDERAPAFYGFVAMPDAGAIHLAGYFDAAASLDDVIAAWRSIAVRDV